MNRRTPPAFATLLLRRFGPENEALSGDLAEAYAAGKSAWWYWGQVLAVIGTDAYRVVRPSLWWSGAAIAATMLVMEVPVLLHLPTTADGRSHVRQSRSRSSDCGPPRSNERAVASW